MASSGISIPTRKRLSESDGLTHEYSQTPGGTLYGTTPGGTRIIYERNLLMQMRNSPVASTPPANLPFIPGVTKGDAEQFSKAPAVTKDQNSNNLAKAPERPAVNVKKVPVEETEETEFQMEL